MLGGEEGDEEQEMIKNYAGGVGGRGVRGNGYQREDILDEYEKYDEDINESELKRRMKDSRQSSRDANQEEAERVLEMLKQ